MRTQGIPIQHFNAMPRSVFNEVIGTSESLYYALRLNEPDAASKSLVKSLKYITVGAWEDTGLTNECSVGDMLPGSSIELKVSVNPASSLESGEYNDAIYLMLETEKVGEVIVRESHLEKITDSISATLEITEDGVGFKPE
jgi:hypothetical protein